MIRTVNFRFPYLQRGDQLYQSDELQRWKTADANVPVVGGVGIESGFSVTYNPASFSCTIGSGVIWVEGQYYTLGSDTGLSGFGTGQSYTIYARIYDTWRFTTDGSGYLAAVRDLRFGKSTGGDLPEDSEVLAQITIDALNNATLSTNATRTAAFASSAQSNILTYLANHHHTGSPSQVSLGTEVQGVLAPEHIASVPGSRFSTGAVTLGVDNSPTVSHIGRVKEVCSFVTKQTFTRDYLAYLTDPWVGDVLVFVNGVRRVSGFTVNPVLDVNGTEYGQILFADPLTVVDRVTVASDLTTVKAPEGGWDEEAVVTVLLNGQVQDPFDYSLDGDEGTIKFNTPLVDSDVVEATIQGLYITDVGSVTHDDVDAAIGDRTSWDGWWPSFIQEFNLTRLSQFFKRTNGVPIVPFQARGIILPQDLTLGTGSYTGGFNNFDDWESRNATGGLIDTEKSTVHMSPTGLVTVDIVGPYANDTPTLPMRPPEDPAGGSYPAFSQSFYGQGHNISRAQFYIGRGGVNTDYTLGVAVYDESGGTDTPDISAGALGSSYITPSAIPAGGGVVDVFFSPSVTISAGNQYCLVLSPEGTVNDSGYFEVYRASQGYPGGSGATGNASGAWSILPYTGGSDDLWFKVFGTTLSYGDTPAEVKIVEANILATAPVEAAAIEGGSYGAFSQSFYVAEDNLSKVGLYLSRTGAIDYSLDLLFYPAAANNTPDVSGGPLGTYGIDPNLISESGALLPVQFVPDFSNYTPGSTLCAVLRPNGTLGPSGNFSWWRASESYTGGSGAYGSTGGVWTILPTLSDSGSDDFYFAAYTHTLAAGSFLETIKFPQSQELLVNPLISIVIDCSGSTLDSDPSGSRFTAAKQFIQDLIAAYNVGEDNDARRALFDIITFTTVPLTAAAPSAQSYGTIYGILGAASSMSADETTLDAALDALNDSGLWLGGTPLHDAISIAAERLQSVSGEGGFGSNRPKAIFVLTDGLENGSNSSQDETIDILTNLPDYNPQVFAIGFGAGLLSESDLNTQATLLYRYADATDGRYYSDASYTSISTILDDIKANPAWITGDFEQVYTFDTLIWMQDITMRCVLEGSSSGTVDIYTMSDTEEDWQEVAVGSTLSEASPPTITVGKFVRYIKFVFHLTAGSTPSVSGATIHYQTVHESYLYTRSFRVLKRVQELSMSFPRVWSALPTGSSVNFGVSEGSLADWDLMRKLADYDREAIPARKDEACSTDDYLTYRAQYGAWPGDHVLSVMIDGVVAGPSRYSYSSFSGTVTFLEEQDPEAAITITLTPERRYVVGVQILHVDSTPPLDFDFGWLYSTRPRL